MSEEVVSEGERQTEEIQREQSLRSDCYLFLAGLLSQAPAQTQLEALAELPADSGAATGDIAAAWQGLSRAALDADESAVEEEYFALFVGLGRGELVPFGSWYITGFLQEQPLSDVRDALAELGLTRVEGSTNTEDHVAHLFAVMAAVIADPQHYNSEQQQALFEQHLAPWCGRFFHDLRQAKSAKFYAAVGALGEAFMAFESQYFSMPR